VATGEPIGEIVEIRLRHQLAGERTTRVVATQSVVIQDLTPSIAPYDVDILPATYPPQTRPVEIRESQTTDLCVVFHRPDRGDKPCEPCPAPKVPDHFDEHALASAVAVGIAGAPADGSVAPAATSPKQVIWIDNGDEVLVHLDSIRTRIMDGLIIVSIDLESDQTGRTPLVVTFAVGRDDDPAGLIAVTDEFPRGNGLLASRWGRALQAAAWQALLALAREHATERGSAPLAIAAVRGRLSLKAGAALRVGGGSTR